MYPLPTLCRPLHVYLCALGLALCSSACEAPPPGEDDEALGVLEQPITRGTEAPGDHAVVSLSLDGGQGLASGTIVHLDDTGGFVLTCRHCVRPAWPDELRVGMTFFEPEARLAVKSVAIHPDGLDIAMIQFEGQVPSTVTPIKPLSPLADTVSSGDPLRHVGFGRSYTGGGAGIRRQGTGPTYDGGYDFLAYDQQEGSGTCQGDSGGPNLVEVDGKEWIAGVTVIGDYYCQRWGNSVRVSTVYDDFIVPFITERTPVEPCPDCVTAATSPGGACQAVDTDCDAMASCGALRSCMAACGSETTCRAGCLSQSTVAARRAYERLERCVYGDACWLSCNDDDRAPRAQACGVDQDLSDYCRSCLESSCCGAGYACAGDPTCRDCNTNLASLQACAESATTATTEVVTLADCAARLCERQCDDYFNAEDTASQPDTTADTLDGATGNDVLESDAERVVEAGPDATGDCACATVTPSPSDERPLGPLAMVMWLGGALMWVRRRRHRSRPATSLLWVSLAASFGGGCTDDAPGELDDDATLATPDAAADTVTAQPDTADDVSRCPDGEREHPDTGLCVRACQQDPDCLVTHQVCLRDPGVCIDSELTCETSVDCLGGDAGLACDPVVGRCVAACSADAQCALGLNCIDGVCTSDCGGQDCRAQGMVCDRETQQCYAPCTPEECAASGQICDLDVGGCRPREGGEMLCSSCAADACAGDLQCIRYDAGNAFCSLPCATSAHCPADFRCEFAFSFADAPSDRYCVPDTTSGQCDGCERVGCPEGEVCAAGYEYCVSMRYACETCAEDWQCGDGGRCLETDAHGNRICMPACEVDSDCESQREGLTCREGVCGADDLAVACHQCDFGPDVCESQGLLFDPARCECRTCVDDTDCDAGLRCIAQLDACADNPMCHVDSQCPDGGRCVDRTFQDPGYCVDCLANYDCGLGQRCDTNARECVPCDCADDEICDGGFCKSARCASVFDCWQVYDGAFGWECDSQSSLCFRWGECEGQPGEVLAPCPAGEACVVTAGETVARCTCKEGVCRAGETCGADGLCHPS